jgi:hypothetical protein
LKRNLEIFPLPLGHENEEGYEQASRLVEDNSEELQNKI